MKTQTKIMLAIAGTVVMALALAVVANAQGGKANLKLQRQAVQQNMMARLRAFLGPLDLTQGQKDQVKAIIENHKVDIQTVTRENVLARRELDTFVAKAASQNDLQTAFDKATRAEWDATVLRAKVAAEIRNILTADQLAKLEQRLQTVDTRIQNRLNKTGK